jgi:hypothetical protein
VRSAGGSGSAPSSPSSDGRVRVYLPYSGEDSLAKAKQYFSDAFIQQTPQGQKIQVGIYADAASAGDLITYLRNQGMQAELGQ